MNFASNSNAIKIGRYSLYMYEQLQNCLAITIYKFFLMYLALIRLNLILTVY